MLPFRNIPLSSNTTHFWGGKKKTWSMVPLVSLFLTFLPPSYFWIEATVSANRLAFHNLNCNQQMCIHRMFLISVSVNTLQLREHLAKGQRTLAGEGMSQIVRSLLELLQRRSYYSGDLLFSTEILRNVTDTFKRATYIPAPDDVQVRGAFCCSPLKPHTIQNMRS